MTTALQMMGLTEGGLALSMWMVLLWPSAAQAEGCDESRRATTNAHSPPVQESAAPACDAALHGFF